jgi:hypothetical protein
MALEINISLGTEVHACDPSYSGGRDLGGSWFEASPGKKLSRPISINKLGMVMYTPHPSYLAGAREGRSGGGGL